MTENQSRVGIQFGENVRSVRQKIGMEANDYLSLWRTINTKAQEICQRSYGNTSLKQANTLLAITELRDHYINNKDSHDQKIHQKMVEALAVEGFAAWIIHNAIKRNNDKTRKAQQAIQPSNQLSSTGASAGKTGTGHAENTTSKVMFDPVRNI